MYWEGEGVAVGIGVFTKPSQLRISAGPKINVLHMGPVHPAFYDSYGQGGGGLPDV